MLRSANLLLVIGQLPPPATGLSIVTDCVASIMSDTMNVVRVTTSPNGLVRGARYHLMRVARTLNAMLRLIEGSSAPNRSLYMPCSGGVGIVYVVLLGVTARVLRYHVVLHHHSYSYIDRTSRLMSVMIRLLGKGAQHIFLCDAMAAKFSERYAHNITKSCVDNAAFIEPPRESLPAAQGVVRIGMLANLCKEKGLHVFLQVVEELAAKGVPFEARLAGPITSTADEIAVQSTVRRLGGALTWLGPVSAEGKERFYRSLDVFLFPTLYRDEAQPLVLYEALAHGCVVLSSDRGSIKAQLGPDGDAVPSHQFQRRAVELVSQLAANWDGGSLKRARIRSQYAQRHHAALVAARQLFDRVFA